MAVKAPPIALFVNVCALFARLVCMAEESPFREMREPFGIDRAAPQKGWVATPSIPARSWRPVEQKNLAQELDSVGSLTLQSIAPAPRRVAQGHLPYLCPNPDGKSWDMLNPYHKKYLSQGQILVHDFGSDESKLFNYGTSEGENVITPCSTDFHMKSSYYLAGKMIFALPTRNHGLLFLVYDPAVNDFVNRTTPFGARFDLYALDIGDDNRLYGMGQPGSRNGLQAFIFDPETYETRIYPQKGSGQKTPFPYYRGSTMHGDWLYCKYGHAPWNLVAFNFRTEEFRHLATTQEIKGDHTTIGIGRHPGGISARIKQGDDIPGVASFGKDLFECWLMDGKVIPRTDDIAPWSNKPVQRQPRPKLTAYSSSPEYVAGKRRPVIPFLNDQIVSLWPLKGEPILCAVAVVAKNKK